MSGCTMPSHSCFLQVRSGWTGFTRTVTLQLYLGNVLAIFFADVSHITGECLGIPQVLSLARGRQDSKMPSCSFFPLSVVVGFCCLSPFHMLKPFRMVVRSRRWCWRRGGRVESSFLLLKICNSSIFPYSRSFISNLRFGHLFLLLLIYNMLTIYFQI